MASVCSTRSSGNVIGSSNARYPRKRTLIADPINLQLPILNPKPVAGDLSLQPGLIMSKGDNFVIALMGMGVISTALLFWVIWVILSIPCSSRSVADTPDQPRSVQRFQPR